MTKLVYKADDKNWNPIKESDLDTVVDFKKMKLWDVCCVIGQAHSWIECGYPDHFDGCDYQDHAAWFMDQPDAEYTPRSMYLEWKKDE